MFTAPVRIGAAAILLQAYPELSPAEVKARLATTAVPRATNDVYQQGGGRIDVPAALNTPVQVTPSPVNLGYFRYPQEDIEPASADVTYTNLTDQPLTLDLTLEVRSRDGAVPSDDMLSVQPGTLTLGPRERSAVTVTVDVTAGAHGLYGGYLVAEAGGAAATRTPVGFYHEPERYDLTVQGVARDGSPWTRRTTGRKSRSAARVSQRSSRPGVLQGSTGSRRWVIPVVSKTSPRNRPSINHSAFDGAPSTVSTGARRRKPASSSGSRSCGSGTEAAKKHPGRPEHMAWAYERPDGGRQIPLQKSTEQAQIALVDGTLILWRDETNPRGLAGLTPDDLKRKRLDAMLSLFEAGERSGLAKWRYVTTGLENETHVEIVEHAETDMVRPDEIVLTGGHYTLIHDARVQLVENVRAAGGRPD